LAISRHGSDDSVAFVVKEPASGRFFRFREVEGYLLEQLDGTQSLEEIREKIRTRFGAPLSQETLEQFLRRLRNLGLLEDPNGETHGHALAQRRIRGNVFYLRLRAFNPDRLLDRMVIRLRFLFTPSFVVLSAASILIAAGITYSQWWEISHDFRRLFTVQSVVMAYLTVLAVVTAHEFAHGLTCKYFGGSVREIGFLLLYFQPAFYCNVSDAWLFPERSKRLWVTFAGAYFELFLWALATFIWRLTDPFTFINYLALVVMATSGVKSLFNMNPLIKLDGYYLLSDYLEVPNLRARAFTYLGDRLRKLWGSAVQHLRDATPRERRIYWIYGLLAWAYSWSLLTLIAWNVGGALVRRYQAWGFIFFAILLGGLFQQPLKKLLHAPWAFFRVRAGMSIWQKRVLRISVLAVLLVLSIVCRTELRISGEFTVLPMRNADVRAEVEGIIQEIYVDEGDTVKKGDRIASLFDRDYRAELRKLKGELEERQARLNLLKAGSRPEEIEMARTLVGKAEERIKYARIHLEMDKALVEDKLISQREFQDTKELVFVREKELQEAEDKLRLLLAGSRKEEIEAVAAEISRLGAQQRYLEDQLQLLTVVSPITGVITTHRPKEKIGQNAKKGDLIAEVHELNTVTAEISIPEKEIADIKVGQAVLLKARAYPQTSFAGTVTSIAPVATTPDDARAEHTILVVTRLDNASRLLKSEMTGNAKIYCGQRRFIELVTRRMVRFVKVEFWSWW